MVDTNISRASKLTDEELAHILEYEDENYILNTEFYG